MNYIKARHELIKVEELLHYLDANITNNEVTIEQVLEQIQGIRRRIKVHLKTN